MYARVWRFNVFPERVEPFRAACKAVLALLRKRSGFRALVITQGGSRDSPESTVVSAWESLESLRASENDAFQRAAARVLACCQRGAFMREEEVLVCDVSSAKKKKRRRASRGAS